VDSAAIQKLKELPLRNIAILAVSLALGSGCASIPAPTTSRPQNPANPTATESPRSAFEPVRLDKTAEMSEPRTDSHVSHSMSSMSQSSDGVSGTEPIIIGYTCSMHPEVRSPEPGECPKCGMDLVPVSEPEKKP